MVSPASRRRAVKYLVEEGLSTAAQAYRALGLARSSYYLVSRKRPGTLKLNQKIVELSEQHPALWLPAHYGLAAPQGPQG
jgi:hypothetical protein